MDDATAKAAVLPFQIVESFDVGCGYERSFKLSRGRILANRYLLGVETAKLAPAQLLDACRRLGMPAALLEQFEQGLPEANLVLLGFEDGEGDGCLYKIYLEHWESLRRKLSKGTPVREPHLLHKGFKWRIDAPERHVVTRYQCLPWLEPDGIRQHIEAIYRAAPQAAGLDAVERMLGAAERAGRDRRMLFVEVDEPGNPRRSFDLNLYAAGLRMSDVMAPVREAARALEVPADKLQRLMAMIPDKYFGHVSGGVSRHGREYLTIYYER